MASQAQEGEGGLDVRTGLSIIARASPSGV